MSSSQGNSGSSTDPVYPKRPLPQSLDTMFQSRNSGDGNSMYVYPPTMTSKRSGSGQQQQSSNSNEPVQNRPPTTRARASSGIPPPLTLEDLQYLDEDSLKQALDDNPHLAEQIARMKQEQAFTSTGASGAGTDQMSSRGSRTGSGSSRAMKRMDRPYRRRPDGTVYQEEDSYLEEMRKDGIPILKWITVLILLLALFYQIYQTLKGPDTGGSGGKDKKKKSSKQQKRDAKNAKLDAETLERLAAEVGPSVQQRTSGGTSTTSFTKKKAQKKKAKSTNNTTATLSSAGTATTTTSTIKKRVQSLDRTLPAAVGNDEFIDQGSWHVVGKTAEKKKETTTSSSPTTKETTAAAAVAPETSVADVVKESSGDTPKEPTEVAPATTPKNGKSKNIPAPAVDPPSPELVPVDESGTTAEDEVKEKSSGPLEAPVPEPATAPKQESSKKKQNGHQTKATVDDSSARNAGTGTTKEAAAAAATTTTSGNDTPTTASEDDDAALAKQLQQQEDKLAKPNGTSSTSTEDVWEEVITKKRRPKV